MPSITRTAADFAAGLTYSDLPPEVARRAKLLVFDTLGIALRARRDAESTESLIAAVKRLGMTGGAATVIGDPECYTAAGRGADQRRARPFAGFRRHPRPRLDPCQRADCAGGARRGGRGRRIRCANDRRHRRGLRGPDPAQPRARPERPLRTRLSPHGDLRRLRRGGGCGQRPGPRRRADRERLRHLPQQGRRLDAVPRRRRLDQALPCRPCRHVRPDGGNPGGPRAIAVRPRPSRAGPVSSPATRRTRTRRRQSPASARPGRPCRSR